MFYSNDTYWHDYSLFSYIAGGPCLVHTLNGDLLRSLDPPEGSTMTAHLITMSRETFVIVKFDEGVICNFSINGRLQKHIKHKDNIQVTNYFDYSIL